MAKLQADPKLHQQRSYSLEYNGVKATF